MGQVLDEWCKQTRLGRSSAESGNEIFVTLSREGDVATMTPTVSTLFKRPPGTIAGCVASVNSILPITCVDSS